MVRSGPEKKWPVRVIIAARAVTIGLAYYNVSGIPGVTSSFLSILGSMLLFDTCVAMERLAKGYVDLQRIVKEIIPQALATGYVLIKGLAVGVLFGFLVKLGLPVVLGTVLTMGIAYTISELTPKNMSDYVGLIGALAIYNKVLALPDIRDLSGFYAALADITWTNGTGTFLALLGGMAIGTVTGFLTRAVLPRGYRSKHSRAYCRPVDLQPFREVIELERGRVTAHVVLSANSPFAHKSLAETGLLSKLQARVLAIQRDTGTIPLPQGSDVLEPGDSVIVLAPVERITEITRLLRGGEQVQGES